MNNPPDGLAGRNGVRDLHTHKRLLRNAKESEPPGILKTARVKLPSVDVVAPGMEREN